MDELLAAVNAAIASYRAEVTDAPRIEVSPTGVRRDGDWYYVVVTAQDRPERSTVYYDHLSAIERRLEKEGYQVLLVPTLLTFVPGS